MAEKAELAAQKKKEEDEVKDRRRESVTIAGWTRTERSADGRNEGGQQAWARRQTMAEEKQIAWDKGKGREGGRARPKRGEKENEGRYRGRRRSRCMRREEEARGR